jgi:hypothetical protein
MALAPDNNYIQPQGTIPVFPGGGSAALPLFVGPNGSKLKANSTATNGLGVDWESSVQGTFTLSSGTTTTMIAAPSITNSSVISYTTTSLGTVTVPQALLFTISAGHGFTISSASSTDSSSGTWALIA